MHGKFKAATKRGLVNNGDTGERKGADAAIRHASGAQIHIKIRVVERVNFRKIRARHKHALACALQNKAREILLRKLAKGRVERINQPTIKHNNTTARLVWIWNK